MKVNLATTETVSSNYAGADAEKFISAALLSATSIENGAVDVVQDVPYKWNVPNVNLSGIVADATCDFTAAGTITIADRVLTTIKKEVNLALCKKTYRPMWQSIYKSGRFTGSFEEYLGALVAANVAAANETFIWQDGTYGIETLLAADAALPAAQEVTGTTLSAANIVAELGKVKAAAPIALRQSDGYAIRLGTKAKDFYISAMAALGYMDRFHDGQAPLNFEGIPLLEAAGMSDDVMIATKADNLFYGVEDLDLGSQVRFLDQSGITGADNVHIVYEWGHGVQYGNVTNIVTYGISNVAN